MKFGSRFVGRFEFVRRKSVRLNYRAMLVDDLSEDAFFPIVGVTETEDIDTQMTSGIILNRAV